LSFIAGRQRRWRQRDRDELIALARGFVSDARADVAAVNKSVAGGRLVVRQKPLRVVSIGSMARRKRRGGGFIEQ
jgi:hypothetical protein